MKSILVPALLLSVALLGCRTDPDADDTGNDDTGTTTDDTGDDTSDDTGDDSGDTGSTTDCHVLPSSHAFTGAIPSGITITNTMYTNTETGLDQVITAALAASGRPYYAAANIAVTDAIVQNVGYKWSAATGAVNFWVANGDGVIQVLLRTEDDTFDTNNVVPGHPALTPFPKPGDKVSFTVSEVGTEFGEPTITGISNWPSTITETGDVYVRESTGNQLTTTYNGTAASDIAWTHHIYGEIVTDSTSCGSTRKCFDLKHGGANGQTIALRVWNSANIFKGDCVDFYASLGAFSSAAQINAADNGFDNPNGTVDYSYGGPPNRWYNVWAIGN